MWPIQIWQNWVRTSGCQAGCVKILNLGVNVAKLLTPFAPHTEVEQANMKANANVLCLIFHSENCT